MAGVFWEFQIKTETIRHFCDYDRYLFTTVHQMLYIFFRGELLSPLHGGGDAVETISDRQQ